MIYSFLTYYYVFLVLDYLGQDDFFFQVTGICLKISGCSCYKQLSPLYKCTIACIHLIMDISCKQSCYSPQIQSLSSKEGLRGDSRISLKKDNRRYIQDSLGTAEVEKKRDQVMGRRKHWEKIL